MTPSRTRSTPRRRSWTLPDPLTDAEEAVCKAIAKRADSGQTPEDLKKLAEGVSAMKWGPSGGRYDRTDRMDYHYTTHGGEDRERPPAGFGEPER